MSFLILMLIVFVGVSIVLFIPLGRWRNLENNFLLEESPVDVVVSKRFTDILLDGMQLNGLVSVFVYKDCLVLKHISPLMKPLVFGRSKVSKTNKRRTGFDVFEASGSGVKIEVGLRKGILETWNVP